MDEVYLFIFCREIFPDEERSVQRRFGNLQKVSDSNDQSFRVPQNCRGKIQPEFMCL